VISEPMRLTVTVGLGPEASAEERDETARRLRQELEDAGLGQVQLARAGDAPPGTKSAEAFVFGALLLSLLPSTLSALAAFSRDWAGRQRGRTLTFSYGAGAQRFEFQYDPEQTDVSQLVAQLVQAQSANRLEIGAGSDIGGDVVGGDKVSTSTVGGDSVGRDKVTHVHAAPGATIIISDGIITDGPPGPVLMHPPTAAE
jgi:hypothetical protein